MISWHCTASASKLKLVYISASSVPSARYDSLWCLPNGWHLKCLAGSCSSICRQRIAWGWDFGACVIVRGRCIPFKHAHKTTFSKSTRKERGTFICAAASSSDSLYDTLGVSPTATEREIKQAYRRLALKYHPDVNKERDAQAKFMQIKHAYQTLVDSKTRSKYDSSQRYANNREGFSWGSSTTRQEEDFYGLGEFLRDLQISLEDFFRDLQADFQKATTSGKPKSLWEELAEIGEEFVEFLEKELNIVDATDQSTWDMENLYDFDWRKEKSSSSKDSTKQNVADETKGKTSKVEKDIDEIEDMLAELKKELGL